MKVHKWEDLMKERLGEEGLKRLREKVRTKEDDKKPPKTTK